MPLIIAAVASTVLIIILLALGVSAVTFVNPVLTLALIGMFAIGLIVSENIALHLRMVHSQPGEAGYGLKCLHWHHKLALWIGIALLAYVLVLSTLFEGVLVLSLISLWILSFLLFSAVIVLL